MIFQDESGKRWKRIKVGAGLISSGAILPVAILLGASALYLPDWGSISLPQPLKPAPASNNAANQPQVLSSQAAQNTQSQNRSTAGTPADQPNAAASTQTSQPAANPTQDTSTSVPSQPSPAQGAAPDDTKGKSDYGQSHKPTRS